MVPGRPAGRPAGRTDWALRAGALKSEAAKKTNRLLACPCVIIIIIILLVLLTHARLSAVADAGWTDDPLSRGQNKLNLTSVQRILTIGCIACRAVIEVWIIHFAAYTAADSQWFSMGRITPKIFPSRGGSQPYGIHGSLSPLESAPPQRHLDRFSRFLQQFNVINTVSRDRQTDRQTDHATYDICCSKQHLCYACHAE